MAADDPRFDPQVDLQTRLEKLRPLIASANLINGRFGRKVQSATKEKEHKINYFQIPLLNNGVCYRLYQSACVQNAPATVYPALVLFVRVGDRYLRWREWRARSRLRRRGLRRCGRGDGRGALSRG